MRNIIQFAFLFLLISHVAKSQTSSPDSIGANNASGYTPSLNSFFLQNTKYPEKKIMLESDFISLQVDENKIGKGHLSRLSNLECAFDSILGDSLTVNIINEEIEIEYLNRFVTHSTSFYEGNFTPTYKNIALGDIMYINTKNNFRKRSTQIGSIIMGLSVLAIVASPLAGLSLQGEARGAARTKVFMSGVGGFVVAIPFFIIGKNKKYGISPNFETKYDNYWTLRQVE